MKVIVLLVSACLVLLVTARPAEAGVVWTNGNVTGAGTHCDFTGNACPGGDNGWTIFDDFQLSDDTVVSGFTYDSLFTSGSPSDYVSTNWSIWANDPLGAFGFLGPAASGNVVAALSPDAFGATTFTITGLSTNLSAGRYWLGYENVLASDGAVTLDVAADGSLLPGFEQESDDQNPLNQFTYQTGNTAFTIDGAAPVENGVPEPASFWLTAVAAAAYSLKSRITRLRAQNSGR